jgi:uncharacterized NAD(P)/FAD-binding protein YdhS
MGMRDQVTDVAVIGGGFSGAAVAIHLLEKASTPLRITVIEPRATLGAGLAYGTDDPAHRINVPAARMSVFAGDIGHFERWLARTRALEADAMARRPDGRVFTRRRVFGRYVAATLAEAGAEAPIPPEHRRGSVVVARRLGSRFQLALADGDTLSARAVVLAVSHPPPAPPAALAAYRQHPAVIAEPGRVGRARIAPQERILIVGTGLTMADVVASLAERGHEGPLVAVSRRGLLSRGHDLAASREAWPKLAAAPTALALLRAIRAEVDAAARRGLPWQVVFDMVRQEAPRLWSALPEAERRRVVARLRAFWDVHRFRIAPQPEAAIARLRAQGRLTVHAAHLIGSRAEGKRLRISFAGRGGAWDDAFDRVVLATGPGHAGVLAGNPVLTSLRAAGLLRADPGRLGLDVDAESQAIGADGAPVQGLFVAGPLARWRFGELMGLPEVAAHAEAVAAAVLRDPAFAPFDFEPAPAFRAEAVTDA